MKRVLLFCLLISIGFSEGLSGQSVINSFVFQEESCTPDPNEEYTTANAASDPNCNEGTGTSGWSAFRTGGANSTAEVYAGTNSMIFTADVSNSTSFFFWTVPGTTGDTFDISFWYYAPTSNSADMAISNQGLGTSYVGFLTEGAWTEYTASATLDSSGTYRIRIFNDDTGSSAGDGNIIYIDNVSVIQTN